MNIKKIVIIGLSILIVASLAYWFFLIRLTKEKAIKIIVGAGMNNNPEFLNGADEGYVINWAKAYRKAEPTFEYKKKTYLVVGGKAK